MTATAIARSNTQISRPLKILVPLIKIELADADAAGIEHYRQAGEMLIEAKEQVPYGSWGRWLSKNFELSQSNAVRYMRLARKAETDKLTFGTRAESDNREERKPSLTSVLADRINVDRLADERQSRGMKRAREAFKPFFKAATTKSSCTVNWHCN